MILQYTTSITCIGIVWSFTQCGLAVSRLNGDALILAEYSLCFLLRRGCSSEERSIFGVGARLRS